MDTEKYTFYSLRRFMPTAAGAFQLDDTGKAAIGNWQENVGPTDSKAKTAKMKMSIHYSGEKVAQAIRAKNLIVSALAKSLEEVIPGACLKLRQGISLAPDTFTWSSVYCTSMGW